MEWTSIARILAVSGIILLLLAGGIALLSRWEVPLGKLPGDIVIKRENFTCAFPLASSIVLSILLTLILNLIIRILQK